MDERQAIPTFRWYTAEDPLGAISAHMQKYGKKPAAVLCNPADLAGIRAKLPSPITVTGSPYVQRHTLYVETAEVIA